MKTRTTQVMRVLLFILLHPLFNFTPLAQIDSIKAKLKELRAKQNQVELTSQDVLEPNLVPPSPTAASLGKYTDFPVNLYNGVTDISIPIYEVKTKTVSVPISLSYHASGIKVGEVASWVGLGFSLNISAITRSVRGLPDEETGGFFSTRLHYPNPDNISFATTSPSIWQPEIVGVAKGTIDFEQDIYMLSAMGKSYKLLFKSNGTIQTIPRSDLKITVNFNTNTWQVVLEDGTRLVFGGDTATEITDGSSLDSAPFGSTWYLKTLTSHQGDVITFVYNNSIIPTDITFSESDFIKVIEPPYSGVTDSDNSRITLKTRNIGIKRLTRILSDNVSVEFVPEPTEREDLEGDYALSTIKVTPKGATTSTEEYKFTYSYSTAVSSVEHNPNNNTTFRKRLKLLSIERKVGSTLYQPWRFEYNPVGLPSRRAFAQDHWGYFNGAVSNQTLLPDYYLELPSVANIDPMNYGFFPPKHRIGNKEPDAVAMKAEILQKVTYPTGGYTQLFYEANAYTTTAPVKTAMSQTLNLNAATVTALKLPNGVEATNTLSFSINDSQYINLSFQGEFSAAALSDVNPTSVVATLALRNTSGTILWSINYRKNQLVDNAFIMGLKYLNIQNITTAQTFTLELRTNIIPQNSNDYSLSSTVKWYSLGNPTPKIQLAGGLRMAKTKTFDGLGAKSSEKFYQYENPFVIYQASNSDYLTNIDDIQLGEAGGVKTSHAYTRNSSAKFTLGSIQGGTIGYGKVTILSDSLGANGKTVSSFLNNTDEGVAESKVFPFPPINPKDYKRGLLTQQIDYRNDGTKVRQIDNTYLFEPSASISGVKAGYNTTYCNTCCTNANNYCGILYSIYLLSADQVKQVTSVEQSFEPTGQYAVETKTSYFYDNSNYTQISRTLTTESKAKKLTINSVGVDSRSIETSMKYAYDFPSNSVLAGMTAKNMIASPIEKTTRLVMVADNGTISYAPLNYQKTSYSQWSLGDSMYYLPQKIETQLENGPLLTQIDFLSYDTRTNLTRYQLRNGISMQLAYYTTTDVGKIDLVKTHTIGGGVLGNILARTNTYNYFPLVGLSSINDINGYNTTFGYDNFNRLSTTTDHQGYLLADYFYHYPNESAPTNRGVSPTNTMAYVISRTARTAQTGSVLDPDITKTHTQVQYIDGLGKPLQTLNWKASPSNVDLVSTSIFYDSYSRVNTTVLPFASSLATGQFVSNSLAQANAFYADTCSFSRSIYEPSPLNRIGKQFGAGQAWRFNDKFTAYSYLTAGNEVVMFNINTNGSVSANTRYPESSLHNTLLTSERGLWTIEIKDRQARTISKYQQLEAGTFNFAITAYVYDDLGRLRYVVPPEAYKLFDSGTKTTFTETETLFLEGIYGYHYDNQGRLTEKHIPGTGWTRYVYDKQDRIVLENDDKDANASPNYWKFSQYDALGRVIRTGLINNIGTYSRSQLQSEFDAVSIPYEERGSTLLGYTNRSFPSSYTPAETNVKTVNYYDDYTWQTETAYNFQAANAFHTQANTKGLQTGALVRNLESNDWYKSVNYYDYKGRVIQDFQQTIRGNIIRKDYQYRFNGELLTTRITKGSNIKILSYEYDHLGRKTTFRHSLNGNEKTIAKYIYDEIGRLKSKQFSPTSAIGSSQTGDWTNSTTWQGGSIPSISDNVRINTGHNITIPTGKIATAGSLFNAGTLQNYGTLNLGSLSVNTNTGILQTIDYKYHIRGGLKGINLDANNNLTNSLFSYKLDYEEDGTYYDGNIRNQYWKSNIDGIQRAYQYNYDGASRITAAAYGSTKAGENYALNNVTYDANGNIKTLSRNGATNTNYTSFGNVDNLSYTYQTNSNKLLKIQDATIGNPDLGDFRDATNTDNDYEYWEDGSLKKDKNKKIASITYNYLKLPKTITFDNGRTITTQYDAQGSKLKKIDSNGETTDYEEDEIYVNGSLYQISHDEGRINAQGQYEYNITDHLGNLRVSLKDSAGIATPTQSIFYDPWGLSMKGMQINKNYANFNKHQYNGKEFDEATEFIDLGNRILNPTIGKMMSIDRFSEKYYGMSPYQFAANNPITYVDINGDSISLNKDFSSSKYAMSAYNTFIGTNAGKQFLKDFGIGGKFEKVSIVFGLKNMWATGGTKQFAIDKNGSKKEIRNEDDGLGKGVITSLPSKSTLEFNVNLRWSSWEQESEQENPGEFYSNLSKIDRGLVLLHELQHVRINTEALLFGKTAISEENQHRLMKATDGSYFQERVNYYNQFKNQIRRIFKNETETNKVIQQRVNAFDIK
ncbi:DUF6443 domain-containing protein [Flectobacillus major]|uniref:DUF6443 domain-containing protein n=1 Tax=Flectobacillus major TaxID=103 RepID=UPI000429BE6A|nr:DUF6443 domain-containing protein [Flectobacillus major]